MATLSRLYGDISLAEDSVQDAFAVALELWPIEGIPPNPAGWIVTTARNRAIDSMRRTGRGSELEEAATHMSQFAALPRDVGPVDDDRLRLIFTCCHPALSPQDQMALTLRLLGGLTVDEVARGLLTSEPAMAKRLVRAKHKIKAAKIPYRIPREADLPERLRSVVSVLSLIYNAGSDDLAKTQLRAEAIILARQLARLMPDEAEVHGLLALLLLNEARVPARSKEEPTLLRDQDRGLWDRDLIEEGQQIVRDCIRRNSPGPFQIQAAIQAVHVDGASIEDTNWNKIRILYDQLFALTPTPVVALNRAIAISETEGAAVALQQLDGIHGLEQYHLFHATRGTLLRRLDRDAEAEVAFTTAVGLAPTEQDRKFLESQLSGTTV